MPQNIAILRTEQMFCYFEHYVEKKPSFLCKIKWIFCQNGRKNRRADDPPKAREKYDTTFFMNERKS